MKKIANLSVATRSGWGEPLRGVSTLLMFAAIGLTFPGCGGGGGGGSSGPSGTTVVVQDGNIVGLTLTDSKSAVAVDQGKGTYYFANVATPPITATSRNEIDPVTGLVKIFDAQGNLLVKTFQDLDGDGIFTYNTDIPYGASITVAYSPNPSVIRMNPISALIPANWNGTTPVAGLSADTVKSAATTGIPASTDTSTTANTLRSVAANLTTVQENLVQMGVSAANSGVILQGLRDAAAANGALSVTKPEDIGTALASVVTSQNVATLFGAGVTETVAETAVKTVTDTLKNTIDALATGQYAMKNSESVVAATTNWVKSLVSTTTPAQAVTLISTTAAVNLSDPVKTQDTAIEAGKVLTTSPLANLFASLFIMPTYNLATTANTGVTPLDVTLSGLTGFGLTYASSGVTVAGSGGMAFLNQTLSYDSAKSQYGWAESGKINAAAINLNYAGFRLFSYTTDSAASYHLFALATKEQICTFRFNDGKSLSQKTGTGTKTLFEEIQGMNLNGATRLTCPAT